MNRASPDQSYDPNYFALLFEVEDRHFWFRARNQVINTVIKRLTTNLRNDCRVLEIGCGTGNVLRLLEQACKRGTVVGMDLFLEGLRYARQRTAVPLVQGDIHKPPFGAKFDLIGLFDVLEHMTDDRQVLSDLGNILADEGELLLTVPAHPSLWSYFDEASHHCRRYEPAELESKLRLAGYQVEYLTQYMAGLFPLVWLWRRFAVLFRRRRPGDVKYAKYLANHELHCVPIINELMVLLLREEKYLIGQRIRLPIGTSIICVARKNNPKI